MLDNVVFLSNSIRKSGSSLLFNLQRDLLNALSGRRNCDYSPLEEAGLRHSGGFLPTPEVPKFLRLMNEGKIVFDGPVSIKLHTAVSPQLRDRYVRDDNMFMSMIVRDPLDALMSAMENHRRTGEFVHFDTVENGCRTVNNFFQQIYDTSVGIDEKPIPIVHYLSLKEDPIQTLFDSFHPALRDRITLAAIDHHLDLKNSSKKAAHRLQSGAARRSIEGIPEAERDFVLSTLADFRAKLGYGEKSD